MGRGIGFYGERWEGVSNTSGRKLGMELLSIKGVDSVGFRVQHSSNRFQGCLG